MYYDASTVDIVNGREVRKTDHELRIEAYEEAKSHHNGMCLMFGAQSEDAKKAWRDVCDKHSIAFKPYRSIGGAL